MPSTLITGANRGLGLEFVRQYLAEGWDVYAGVRAPDEAKDLNRLAKDSGGKLRVLQMDVADPTSIERAAAELKGRPIDVLINNAGSMGPRGQRLGDIDFDAWLDVLAINTLGPARVTEAFVENVANSERKTIVTITSGMGSISDNSSGGSVIYRSSKAAVNMVMRTFALDLADRGIISIVVNPGWVRTDMGGPNANMDAPESIRRMRRLIEGLELEHSGKFFNHNGREYPW